MQQFVLHGADGAQLAAFKSLPAGNPRAIVQIAHGMAEHFARYGHLTHALNGAGYGVYGGDHRGHGKSVDVHGRGNFGPGGFAAVVDDMATLAKVARRDHPGLPLILLGHSMGSFAAQLYLLQHSSDLAALVLSGTAALDKLLAHMMSSTAAPGLNVMNANFEPARTGFDWLSRDETEVDLYVADPLCGFDLEPASLQSLFGSGDLGRSDARLTHVHKALPIYIISGAFDPVVGPEQSFARALIASYEAAGLNNITHRVYPGGRHEMFNETNRREVEKDLIAWLEAAVR